MSPYREPVATPAEARYNRPHSKTRCVVERAFGMLKAGWRSIVFKALEVNPNFVPTVVTCCVVLHNLCFANGDIIEAEDVISDDDDDDEDVMCGDATRNRLAAAVSAPDIHVPALTNMIMFQINIV